MAYPFLSPQHNQALTRMMSEDGSGHSASASSSSIAQQQSPGFAGGAPPGFTVITPQEDLTAKWWKLLHFVLSVLFGLGVVYLEYRRSGHLERFDALATDKPLPYGTFQVAATVSYLVANGSLCKMRYTVDANFTLSYPISPCSGTLSQWS